MSAIDPTLVQNVDLLCLDAGNTVVFLDYARLAALLSREGFNTSSSALIGAEGQAKVAIESAELIDIEWSNAHRRAARGWGLLMGTMLHRSGLAIGRLPSVLDALWAEHDRYNLWSLVPDGLGEALERVRRAGVRVAVVSNSEGILERLFEQLGISSAFDLVIDSGVVGIEKPAPGIFRLALERFGIPADRALHLGDTYATDVVGARAASIRVALIDPHGHFAGRHQGVPRVPGAPEVAHAIAAARLSPYAREIEP